MVVYPLVQSGVLETPYIWKSGNMDGKTWVEVFQRVFVVRQRTETGTRKEKDMSFGENVRESVLKVGNILKETGV